MPNGGALPTTATTVVGIGAAGCRMLDAVRTAVERSDPDTAFGYVAIDTRIEDLDHIPPAEATPIALEAQRSSWSDDRTSFTYLTEDIDLPNVGAARTRALGRYHADSGENFEQLYAGLADALETTWENADPVAEDAHQIWLLHSLGGGTGSGTFLLVAAIVQDIAATRAEEFVVGGIGSLPRLDVLEETIRSPPGMTDLYLNSYAALRELAVLLDYDDENPYPLAIDIESEPGEIAGRAIELIECPFDVYGLLGARESQLSNCGYREAMNQVAADTVYGFSQRTVGPGHLGLRCFDPPNPLAPESHLFSIDGGGVYLPTEDITRYWELGDEVQNIESEVSRLEGELAELKGSIHYLNDLLVQGADEESSTPEATDLARSHARNYRRYAIGNQSIEGTIAEIQNRLETPEHVDTETVAAYVFTQMLVERLTQEVQQHPFPEELERAREKYAELVDESRSDGSRGFWEEVLRPALKDRRDRIEYELDETFTGRIFKRSRLEERIEETIEDLDRTQSSFEEYKKLDDTRAEVRNRWEEMDARLRRQRNELEDRQREKRNELEARRRRLSELRTERERVEEQLADRRGDQYTQLPVVNLDDLQPDLLDSLDGLNELIDRGFLEIEEVSRALAHAFDGINEPIEDQALAIDRSHTSEAFLLANDANHELVTEHVGEHPGRIPQTSLDTFDNVTHVDLADPFAIHAVGVFAPIELKNTSEFGTIDEYYTDPNRDLSAQFDAQVTDEDVTRHFAYPELFADGSRITAHFKNS